MLRQSNNRQQFHYNVHQIPPQVTYDTDNTNEIKSVHRMAPSRIHNLSVFNFLELMEKCQNVTINSRINGCHLNKWFHSFEHVTGSSFDVIWNFTIRCLYCLKDLISPQFMTLYLSKPPRFVSVSNNKVALLYLEKPLNSQPSVTELSSINHHYKRTFIISWK